MMSLFVDACNNIAISVLCSLGLDKLAAQKRVEKRQRDKLGVTQ